MFFCLFVSDSRLRIITANVALKLHKSRIDRHATHIGKIEEIRFKLICAVHIAIKKQIWVTWGMGLDLATRAHCVNAHQ